jgi:zinc and cadmium transporter
MLSGVSVLAWIVVSGIAMSAVALVGVLAYLVGPAGSRATLILVALSAGSLVGGALFHMIPGALAGGREPLVLFTWVAAGFTVFFVLEQFLHWHHCHRGCEEHDRKPLGTLILVADGVHNLLGGLAVGGAFLADVRLGIAAWIAAAAHEVPQELGDFGVLVHAGWSPRRALVFNFLTALTFLAGGILAWAVARAIEPWFLLPFAAGNFLYIAAADLIPEIKHEPLPSRAAQHFVAFLTGLLALLTLAWFLG